MMFVDVEAVKRGANPEAGLTEPVYEAVVVPEAFGPVTFELDDSHVKEFAFSQDDYSPWYFETSPFGRRIGHAGILLNDILQLFTLRYAASRVVGLHVEEDVTFVNPAYVGEKVTLSGAYTEKYVRRGQGCVVMEAYAAGEDGRVLVRHRGTEIMRTTPGEVVGRGSAPVGESNRRRVRTEVRTDVAPVEVLMDEVEVDTPLVPLRKRPSQAQMAVFSRVGDWVRNIHNDLDKARAAGLAVPIVQGQQLFCFATELMTRFFGAAWFTSGRLAMKFLRPVYAFDEIEIAAGVRAVPDDGPIELDVWLAHRDGEVAAVGWAEGARLSRRPGS